MFHVVKVDGGWAVEDRTDRQVVTGTFREMADALDIASQYDAWEEEEKNA